MGDSRGKALRRLVQLPIRSKVSGDLMMSFNDRIKNAEFVNDIPHFYECQACGLKSHSRKIIIDHQLDDCDHIGYLEDSK